VWEVKENGWDILETEAAKTALEKVTAAMKVVKRILIDLEVGNGKILVKGVCRKK
jgi:hypothetical protein